MLQMEFCRLSILNIPSISIFIYLRVYHKLGSKKGVGVQMLDFQVLTCCGATYPAASHVIRVKLSRGGEASAAGMKKKMGGGSLDVNGCGREENPPPCGGG